VVGRGWQGGNVSAIASGAASREAWPFILCLEQAGGKTSAVDACADKVRVKKSQHRVHTRQGTGRRGAWVGDPSPSSSPSREGAYQLPCA
jgi:hypothetical protein